jgi:class 3 adenylate cyclase
MLLAVCLVSLCVPGGIALHSGTSTRRRAVEQKLVEVRESRTRELTQYFDGVKSSMITDAQGATAVDAVRGFTRGFAELNTRPEDPAQARQVKKYYADSFVGPYEKQTGVAIDSAALLPRTPAQQYLQATYTATTTDFAKKLATDDAGDGSAWSRTHARYQSYFRSLVDQFGYRDVFLLDTRGNVVYSAYKGNDLGTNVHTGPYRGGGLESVYDGALRSNALDSFTLSDFQPYQPSFDAPTSFAASPIWSDGDIEGVLVVQLPLDRINDITTDRGRWVADGLGSSGEVYLVGPDKLMRSASRKLIEDPTAYREDTVEAGTPPEVAARAVAAGSSVLIQPVDTPAVEHALRGQSGLAVGPAYLGIDALTAYAPLDIDGLDWAIIAKVETAEAYAPSTGFARDLGVLIAGLILLVSLASLLLARVFTRPLARLVAAVRKVAGGDVSTEVAVTSKDEFGDLGAAFNDMSRSLRTKAELLTAQQAENQRLLLMMMPAGIAERYRGGEATIAHEKQNVSVIFADLVGVDLMARGRSSAEMLTLTNSLARAFDEAAEELGIERVRSIRTGYLASCGAVVPRLDNARRTVEFARQMELIVQRFNAQHGLGLGLRVGIDTGAVTAGLVGSTNVVYDLWGEAVNLAYQVRDHSGHPGIFVTERVHDRLRHDFSFRPTTDAGTHGGAWVLDSELARA